jgi:Uncharacterized conserved protein (DUF2163)
VPVRFDTDHMAVTIENYRLHACRRAQDLTSLPRLSPPAFRDSHAQDHHPRHAAHLDEETTRLAAIWRITRKDGAQFFFTDHDRDIVFGGEVYRADAGFERTAIRSDAGFAVDNLDLVGVFAEGGIVEDEVRAGLFDGAEIEISFVNWQDPDGHGEIRLRRDSDDAGRAATGHYWAAGAYFDPPWRGAVLFSSDDGAVYAAADETLAAVAWGVARTALPDTDLPFQTDTTSVLQVAMVSGSLASVGNLEMLNGANLAALIRADGNAELIQFQDVALSAGVYTLTTLLRGRRGTEVFTGGHAVSDLFVLMGR